MLLVSDFSLGLGGFPSPGGQTVRTGRLSMGEATQRAEGERDGEQTRLVAAMARGDKAAFARLYDQLAGPLFSLALRILGERGEAQELLQDIFLQTWRTAASYETGRGTVFSWLATLTRNRAIDRLRMRQRRSTLLAEGAPDLQPAAMAGDHDSAGSLWQRERVAAVRSALAELTADQRQALELAYFGGLTQQEIAAKLNEPLGTIKARIRRGLLRLKDRLPARL